MSFSADQAMKSARHLIQQACLFNKTTPYGHYAPFTSHNLYGNGKIIDALQARKLTGSEQSLVTAAFKGHNGYQQNLLASNEVNACQFIPMAPFATPQQPYCTDIQSWISPFQVTTDYTGLLDATNPATRPKPAHPFYWRKRGNSVPTEGMTRTRDKYRVVYTEKQRVGLEKEFKTNKFITMQRKMEISKELDLSQRQIKIWFQNRRAKERRQRRKTDTLEDGMLDGDMSGPVTELQQNDPSEKFQPNNTQFDVDVSRHSYPSLQTLEDSSTKSQCRFQQNNSRICETGDVRETQEHQSITLIPTSPPEWNQASAHITSCNGSPSEWRQTSSHVGSCNVSPSELRQTSAQMISCNVSPVEWRHPTAQMTGCDVSPSEWRHTSAQMTSSNISPFTANPDWNLMYRS